MDLAVFICHTQETPFFLILLCIYSTSCLLGLGLALPSFPPAQVYFSAVILTASMLVERHEAAVVTEMLQ